MLEDKIKGINHPYKRWIISALSLGVLIFYFRLFMEKGYESLTALLNNDVQGAVGTTIFTSFFENPWFVPLFFFLVALLKVLAMSFTNAEVE